MTVSKYRPGMCVRMLSTTALPNGDRPEYSVTSTRAAIACPECRATTSNVSSTLPMPWSEKKLGSIGTIASVQA